MSSSRAEKYLSLATYNFKGYNEDELMSMARKTLEKGMHGLCFSPYVEGQKPGDQLSDNQIRRRLEIIKPYTKWVRSFSCTEGNENIPRLAKEYGMKTLVGAWLGNDRESNEKELEGLIQLTNEGVVDIAAIGNEVLYRGDLTESELLDYIHRGKVEIEDVPVGYVDAYYEFRDHPKVSEACDIILANCYPFWEGCEMDYSLLYMKDMYRQAQEAAQGKKVIITETGWPSQGTNLRGALPSYQNFLKYFINTQKWSQEAEIEIFFFSSFDESWKVGTEGDVGAYWGLWDKDENLKF
ncbi:MULTISPECIES: glycosyl hydrolase family 17 protein [Maribacter]|uniref:Endo-1,3-beta-glucanase btgC n=1 Tax=Maribacter flavus TaxID=1658664 RepID=A0ABU7IGR4_9FLAO|nr:MULTISPECIES: glycosyl hydrolase family 17 protein [Maribacter]MDC6404660.1 glycosyl hydrolase family 17 protein [Maribacter sp. PR66]MEE1972074.1 glycosyl hydrolase family 17 protein [Maribacter flavus]